MKYQQQRKRRLLKKNRAKNFRCNHQILAIVNSTYYSHSVSQLYLYVTTDKYWSKNKQQTEEKKFKRNAMNIFRIIFTFHSHTKRKFFIFEFSWQQYLYVHYIIFCTREIRMDSIVFLLLLLYFSFSHLDWLKFYHVYELPLNQCMDHIVHRKKGLCTFVVAKY